MTYYGHKKDSLIVDISKNSREKPINCGMISEALQLTKNTSYLYIMCFMSIITKNY